MYRFVNVSRAEKAGLVKKLDGLYGHLNDYGKAVLNRKSKKTFVFCYSGVATDGAGLWHTRENFSISQMSPEKLL